MFDADDDLLFEAGDVLFDTDKPLYKAYFLLEGKVDLTLSLGEKTVSIPVAANHFIGDAAVAVEQRTDTSALSYHGRAVALEPVRAVAIPIEEIRQELEACPPLLRAWIASFTSRILLLVEELSKS